MKMLKLPLAALSFFVSAVCHAASFNCTDAKQPIEIAICSHPELSQADEQLAAAYHTLLGKLTPDGATKLKGVQRRFDKLVRSISVAIRKRPVDPERVERLVNTIVRQLESLGETEIASHVVGEMVMKALKSLDEVAYVRYASVYRDFRETQDFAKFLGDEGLSEEVTDDEGEEPKR